MEGWRDGECVLFLPLEARRCVARQVHWTCHCPLRPTSCCRRYIAPAKLADGSVVDLWAHGANVSWEVPQVAARSGRWKSFAAVGAAGAPEALWRYLCEEWNGAHPPEKQVVRYKYFLLSASIMLRPPLDGGATSCAQEHGPPTKRLLQAYSCVN